MSELKEWTASEIEEYDDARLELAEDGKIECTRVYIKAEVDKVIAELKAENESLLQQNHELCQALQVMYSKEEYDKQKYKRCLAMAEWCDAESDVADADGDYYDMKWYQKWHNRWLELAEKFKDKEAK